MTSKAPKEVVMARVWLTLFLIFTLHRATSQDYTSAAIFAHNDYVRATPFYTAYDLQVGYIEADVFLVDHELFVAHDKSEIRSERSLRTLYLEPLSAKIRQNNGHAYKDPGLALTLMIDLKTEGAPTLDALVKQIEKYPDIMTCSSLNIMISGSVPDPRTWKNYPSYITFDGRPNIPYTTDQLARVRMISTSFREHVNWDGTGRIPDDAAKVMTTLRDEAHAKNKTFRFWATPDSKHAWRELMRLKMDVIVTDDVMALARFLSSRD